MKLTPSISTKLADPDLERVRRNLDERVTQLQGLPASGLKVIQNVSLENATDIPIAHGLGRVPLAVLVSPSRGAVSTGRITETRSATYQRDQVVVLQANGHGATIIVDVVVF